MQNETGSWRINMKDNNCIVCDYNINSLEKHKDLHHYRSICKCQAEHLFNLETEKLMFTTYIYDNYTYIAWYHEDKYMELNRIHKDKTMMISDIDVKCEYTKFNKEKIDKLLLLI